MKKFTDFIVSKSKLIVLVSSLLCLISVVGYVNTKINYDILVYLPEDIETMKGQNILKEDFDMGAFATISIDNSNQKKVLDAEKAIRKIAVPKTLCAKIRIGASIYYRNRLLCAAVVCCYPSFH